MIIILFIIPKPVGIWFMITKTLKTRSNFRMWVVHDAQTPYHIVAIFAKLRYAMSLFNFTQFTCNNKFRADYEQRRDSKHI